MKNRGLYLSIFFLLFIACGVVEKLANRAPTIEEISADSYAVFAGDTVTVRVEASDPDEDELAFTWVSTGGHFINRNGPVADWVAPEREDDYEIEVTVRDKNNGEAKDMVTITVISQEQPDVEITAPKAGEYIVGLNAIEIMVEVTPYRFIESVEFYIDDVFLGETRTRPYTCLWDVDGLSGIREIKAVASRTIPGGVVSADSILVYIEGIIPIPK
jgi:hypothetical protein